MGEKTGLNSPFGPNKRLYDGPSVPNRILARMCKQIFRYSIFQNDCYPDPRLHFRDSSNRN